MVSEVVALCRIDEYGNTNGCRHQLTQEFQPLCSQLATEKIDTCQVAARPGEAGDKTEPDRVAGGGEDDGDRRGCRLGGEMRQGIFRREDHGDLPAHQIGRQLRHPIHLIFGQTEFDRHVLALDITGLLQALAKSAQQPLRDPSSDWAIEKPDHRHRWLLRARR